MAKARDLETLVSIAPQSYQMPRVLLTQNGSLMLSLQSSDEKSGAFKSASICHLDPSYGCMSTNVSFFLVLGSYIDRIIEFPASDNAHIWSNISEDHFLGRYCICQLPSSSGLASHKKELSSFGLKKCLLLSGLSYFNDTRWAFENEDPYIDMTSLKSSSMLSVRTSFELHMNPCLWHNWS